MLWESSHIQVCLLECQGYSKETELRDDVKRWGHNTRDAIFTLYCTRALLTRLRNEFWICTINKLYHYCMAVESQMNRLDQARQIGLSNEEGKDLWLQVPTDPRRGKEPGEYPFMLCLCKEIPSDVSWKIESFITLSGLDWKHGRGAWPKAVLPTWINDEVGRIVVVIKKPQLNSEMKTESHH